MKREDFSLTVAIAERAEKMGISMTDRITLLMDLEFAFKEFNLRLAELLNTDDLNFAHDITGIQQNLNRETEEMENCFLPRYSGNDLTLNQTDVETLLRIVDSRKQEVFDDVNNYEHYEYLLELESKLKNLLNQ